MSEQASHHALSYSPARPNLSLGNALTYFPRHPDTPAASVSVLKSIVPQPSDAKEHGRASGGSPFFLGWSLQVQRLVQIRSPLGAHHLAGRGVGLRKHRGRVARFARLFQVENSWLGVLAMGPDVIERPAPHRCHRFAGLRLPLLGWLHQGEH